MTMRTGFYVSVIRDTRHRLIAGPFDLPPTNEQVETARKECVTRYNWSAFDAFGTCKITTDDLRTATVDRPIG